MLFWVHKTIKSMHTPHMGSRACNKHSRSSPVLLLQEAELPQFTIMGWETNERKIKLATGTYQVTRGSHDRQWLIYKPEVGGESTHAYYCLYLHPYCLLSRYYPLLPITCHIIYWVLLEHAHANQLDDPCKGKPVMLGWICRYLRLSPLIISILQLDQTNLENKLRHQVLN